MMAKTWNVELTPNAENDFADIIHWTRKEFGARRVQIYRTTLKEALQALHDGPTLLGTKKRDSLGADIYTLHIARKGRKGRHFIVFRVVKPNAIEVLRVLHDSMDLAARLVDGQSLSF